MYILLKRKTKKIFPPDLTYLTSTILPCMDVSGREHMFLHVKFMILAF